MSCKECFGNCNRCVKIHTFKTVTPLIGDVTKLFNNITSTDFCSGSTITNNDLLLVQHIEAPISSHSLASGINVLEEMTVGVGEPLRFYSSDNTIIIETGQTLNSINFSRLTIDSLGTTGLQGETGVRGTTGPTGIQGIQGVTGLGNPFIDGSVSTPSIVFTNDPDTGIYRPGTDSVGFAAGGSTALLVNSSVTFPGTLTLSTGPVNRNTLVSNGSGVFTSQTLQLDDLGDVVISNPLADDVLVFNGTNWFNIHTTIQTAAVRSIGGHFLNRSTTDDVISSSSSSGRTMSYLNDIVVVPTDFMEFGLGLIWTMTQNCTFDITAFFSGIISGNQQGSYRLHKNGVEIDRVNVLNGNHTASFNRTETAVVNDVYEFILFTSTDRQFTHFVGSSLEVIVV